MFPDETACLRYLERIRWPDGFVCEKCASVGEPFRLLTHPRNLKCHCLPSRRVSYGAHRYAPKQDQYSCLVLSSLPGRGRDPWHLSFGASKKASLGIKHYETAFQLLHKLRDTMVCPGRDKIGTA